MPRTVDHDNWEDEGESDDSEWTPDDDDDAESEWQEDEDDDETVPCPHCGKPVYEGAEQCPACGNYISEEDSPTPVKPLWIVVGGLICLAIVILWIWQG